MSLQFFGCCHRFDGFGEVLQTFFRDFLKSNFFYKTIYRNTAVSTADCKALPHDNPQFEQVRRASKP
jgi:hypothetical protein